MKVLLIDDHPLILSALQGVIESLGSHVSVVGVGGARAARAARSSSTSTSATPTASSCSPSCAAAGRRCRSSSSPPRTGART
jgi:CheY-like chemotaxis protein